MVRSATFRTHPRVAGIVSNVIVERLGGHGTARMSACLPTTRSTRLTFVPLQHDR
jgi:hypothetical protein